MWTTDTGAAGTCPRQRCLHLSPICYIDLCSDQGPLGITCDPSLHSDYPCYASCAALTGDCSYNENACTFTSCYDDIVYTETVLYDILDRWCVDTDHVHMSGASNGGMFIWSRVMERLAGTLASVGPVCSAPLRQAFLVIFIVWCVQPFNKV